MLERLFVWCKGNSALLLIAGGGGLYTLFAFATDWRWLVLAGGVGLTGALAWHHARQYRAMRRLADANQALMLLEKCHKLVGREKNEIALLSRACTLLVSEGGYRFAWCGFVAGEAGKITPVAFSRLDPALLHSLGETWRNSHGWQEPAASAIRTLRPSEQRNLLTNLAEQAWREQAQRFGYAAALAIPMLEGDRVVGVFNIYSRNPEAFAPEEAALLNEFTDTLLFGLLAMRESGRRKRAEKRLALHRRFLEEQVAKRTRLLNTVAPIAQRLLFQEEGQNNIDAVLQDLGLAANVSRAFIARADAECRFLLDHEWVVPDQSARLEQQLASPWLERLCGGEHLCGRARDFFATSEPHGERLYFALVPILVNESFWGVLGFEDCTRERSWSSGEIDAMRLVARALDASIRKERLIMEKRAGEEQILKLSAAVEQSPNSVMITDALGRIEYVNPQYTLVTGQAAEELLGSVPPILQPQAKSRQEHARMWQTLTEGAPWREELESVKQDGSRFWMRASLAPLVNGAGEITHFVCVQEDITHRKQAELQLRTTFDRLARSENRLQAILDNMPSIVFLKNVSGRYVLANRLFLETFGVDLPAVLNHKDSDLFSAELAQAFGEADHEVLQRGLPVAVDTIIPVAGEKRIFHTVRFPVVADDSGYFSICCIATDITDRKIAQARLLRSGQAQDILNAILLAAMDRSPSLSEFIQGGLSRILSAPWFAPEGKGAVYLFGAGEAGEDLICQIGLGEEGLAERLEKGRGETAWAWRGRGVVHYGAGALAKSGGIPGLPEGWGYYSAPLSSRERVSGVMQIFLPPAHGRNKDEEEFIATVRNTLASILEKKIVDRQLVLAKERAESASLAKSIFLANMSHEVRTPMNGVIGMLDLLGRTRLTATQRHYLAIAEQSAEQQLNIINDILDFSKIEAGRLTLERLPFDLVEVVENIGVMLSGVAQNKGVELVLHLSGRIRHRLIGDAVRLRQVLINLAGNALKFTRSGEVVLRVDLLEEAAESVTLFFAVIDTGIGIAPEARERIFLPFAQADVSTTRRFGGTGLGLVIARQIVEAMGGRMGLASQPEAGSMFWFEARFAKGVAMEGNEEAGLRGLRTLIVDDNGATLTTLTSMLSGWGMRCHGVASGVKALEWLLDTGAACDLAVVDMRMPEMSGLDVARAMREMVPGVRVMLLSSGEHPEEAVLREIGVGAYLMKPVGPARLRQSLCQALRGPCEETGEAGKAVEAESGFAGRVLLVEDTFVNQQVAAGMLKQMGLEVEIAGDGQEGVRKAMEGRADVILMDMQMPVMDGLEATRRIREWEAREGREPTPIVAMTANALSGDRERCLEAGMNDYLAKPVLWEALAAKLALWLPGAAVEEGVAPEEALDRSCLNRLRDSLLGVPGTFAAILEEFLSGTPGLLSAIGEAALRGEPDGVRAAAHALKSNSATVGLTALSELCATMEQAARAGDVAPAGASIARAEALFQAAVPELQEALQQE
ncbi:MAG: response regulator [Magnetococcales bacterium]|nr:response regulator [Magnetococcales bacterium]